MASVILACPSMADQQPKSHQPESRVRQLAPAPPTKTLSTVRTIPSGPVTAPPPVTPETTEKNTPATLNTPASILSASNAPAQTPAQMPVQSPAQTPAMSNKPQNETEAEPKLVHIATPADKKPDDTPALVPLRVLSQNVKQDIKPINRSDSGNPLHQNLKASSPEEGLSVPFIETPRIASLPAYSAVESRRMPRIDSDETAADSTSNTPSGLAGISLETPPQVGAMLARRDVPLDTRRDTPREVRPDESVSMASEVRRRGTPLPVRDIDVLRSPAKAIGQTNSPSGDSTTLHASSSRTGGHRSSDSASSSSATSRRDQVNPPYEVVIQNDQRFVSANAPDVLQFSIVERSKPSASLPSLAAGNRPASQNQAIDRELSPDSGHSVVRLPQVASNVPAGAREDVSIIANAPEMAVSNPAISHPLHTLSDFPLHGVNEIANTEIALPESASLPRRISESANSFLVGANSRAANSRAADSVADRPIAAGSITAGSIADGSIAAGSIADGPTPDGQMTELPLIASRSPVFSEVVRGPAQSPPIPGLSDDSRPSATHPPRTPTPPVIAHSPIARPSNAQPPATGLGQSLPAPSAPPAIADTAIADHSAFAHSAFADRPARAMPIVLPAVNPIDAFVMSESRPVSPEGDRPAPLPRNPNPPAESPVAPFIAPGLPQEPVRVADARSGFEPSVDTVSPFESVPFASIPSDMPSSIIPHEQIPSVRNVYDVHKPLVPRVPVIREERAGFASSRQAESPESPSAEPSMGFARSKPDHAQ